MKSGWQIKQIGDLCEVIAGQSPEGKYYNDEGKGMPFYQGKKDFGEKFIEAPRTWTTQITKVAKEGDILMSVRAPVGPVNFATDEVCIGRGLAAIRSGAELNREFLFYQLGHLQPDIAGREGAVFASINKAEIEALPLVFAPLPEQQRIVGILEKAFEGIATAKANAEKNLQNARALFESHLQSVFTQRGKGWKINKLGEVCSFLNRGISPRYLEAGGICVLNQKCVRNHCVSYEPSRRHDVQAKKISPERLIQSGDVLVNSTGTGTLGRVAQLREKPLEPTTVDSHVTIVRPTPGKFYMEFFGYMLVFIENAIKEAGEGCGGQTELARSVLAEKFSVHYPVSLDDQARHVAMLDALRKETQHLESIYQQKLAALEALKKSLLHQAFNGGGA